MKKVRITPIHLVLFLYLFFFFFFFSLAHLYYNIIIIPFLFCGRWRPPIPGWLSIYRLFFWMLWEMLPSLIPAFALFTLSPSPSPSCTCHAGYLQVDGSIMSEEFFKAAYYGILISEQQVIRLKKEFIPWFIYSLFCLIISPSGQHVKKTIPDVSFNRTKINKISRITRHL